MLHRGQVGGGVIGFHRDALDRRPDVSGGRGRRAAGRTGAKAILLKSGFMMVLFVVVAMIV